MHLSITLYEESSQYLEEEEVYIYTHTHTNKGAYSIMSLNNGGKM
jgi:hypothetical protein